jgi:2-keto-3-deoxy-L-rhamnonate aldolase RhmA
MAGVTPMARVPDIASSTILRFLDRGIMGLTGPHITTPEKARQRWRGQAQGECQESL